MSHVRQGVLVRLVMQGDIEVVNYFISEYSVVMSADQMRLPQKPYAARLHSAQKYHPGQNNYSY